VLLAAIAAVMVLGACGHPRVPMPGGGSASGSGPFGTPATGGETAIVIPSEESSDKPAPLPSRLPGMTLDATLRSTGSRLVADYTVTNATGRTVLVVDRIPKSLGSSRLEATDIAPAHAWVVMAGNVVRVTKQAFPIAPNVRFIADPVIGGHVVEPGGSTKGTAEVSLPPRLDVPGREFQAPRTPVSPAADTWQFCVQVAQVERPRDVVSVSAVAHAPLLCSLPQPLS
jgi:hypothetical protein